MGDENQWQMRQAIFLITAVSNACGTSCSRRQLQVVRIRGLGYLRSLWQVDRSRLRNVTNSCTTASQLSADWIRLIRFQMMPQLSIMRAIQVREPKRLKQATGHVQVDRVH
jgi:hypothetical protein